MLTTRYGALASCFVFVVFVFTATGIGAALTSLLFFIQQDARIFNRAIEIDNFDDGTWTSVVWITGNRLKAECLFALCLSVAFVPNVGWMATRNSLRSLKLVERNRSDMRDNGILNMYLLLCLPSTAYVLVYGLVALATIQTPPLHEEKLLRTDLEIAHVNTLMANLLYCGFATMCFMPLFNMLLWESWAVVKRISNSAPTVAYSHNSGHEPHSSEEGVEEGVEAVEASSSVRIPLLSMRRA